MDFTINSLHSLLRLCLETESLNAAHLNVENLKLPATKILTLFKLLIPTLMLLKITHIVL